MTQSGEYLSDHQQRALRESGVIQESEVALKRGDIVVAIGAVNGQERIVGYARDVLKENKQILKG